MVNRRSTKRDKIEGYIEGYGRKRHLQLRRISFWQSSVYKVNIVTINKVRCVLYDRTELLESGTCVCMRNKIPARRILLTLKMLQLRLKGHLYIEEEMSRLGYTNILVLTFLGAEAIPTGSDTAQLHAITHRSLCRRSRSRRETQNPRI